MGFFFEQEIAPRGIHEVPVVIDTSAAFPTFSAAIHVSLFKNFLLPPAISNTIFPNYSYLNTRRLLLSSDGEGGGGVAD